MQIEKRIAITYRWWNEGKETIPSKHIEALEETAQERIFKMMKEGYTSGELHDNIHMLDSDPKNGIDYEGWWEVEHKTL